MQSRFGAVFIRSGVSEYSLFHSEQVDVCARVCVHHRMSLGGCCNKSRLFILSRSFFAKVFCCFWLKCGRCSAEMAVSWWCAAVVLATLR